MLLRMICDEVLADELFTHVADAAAVGLRRTAEGHQQGRLAGTVGADQGDDLALADFDVDAVQGLDLAVEGGNVFELQHLRFPQVGFDHFRIVADLFRRAVGQRRALVDHDDVVGNAHDQFHVVFDQQHGDVVLFTQHADQRLEVFGFLRVQAGSRFVEHEDPRTGHHAASDFQTTLLTVGQGAGRTVGELP